MVFCDTNLQNKNNKNSTIKKSMQLTPNDEVKLTVGNAVLASVRTEGAHMGVEEEHMNCLE